MPYYIYKNPDKEEYVEVFQRMNDKHTFFDIEGKEWKRVYTVPNLSKDSIKIDPYSKRDFLKATDKSGTLGDMMELSADLSARRAEKEGEDPIKRKFFDDYSKQRNGAKHFEDRKKVVENDRFKIDFTKGE